MTRRTGGLASIVYRALLVAYPRAFRREHARDAAETFVELHRDTRGVRARVRLWARTAARVVGDGLAERAALRSAAATGRGSRVAALARLASHAWRGVRLWRRTPVHAVVAVVVLALGTGVSVAALNFSRTLLWRAPPVAEASALVTLGEIRAGEREVAFAPARAIAMMDGLTSFDRVAAERFGWVWLIADGRAVEAEGALVSFNYFDTIGLTPAAGRLFHERDAGAIAPHSVVVLSERLRAQLFGRDSAVVGRTLNVNGRAVSVIGIAPAGFRGLYAGQSRDVWMPHDLADTSGQGQASALLRAGGAFELVGRLAEGSTLTAARAELEAALRRDPPDSGLPGTVRAFVEPLRGVHPDARAEALEAPGRVVVVAGALLLLACFNVAGLLYDRTLARRSELAVRLSLGETRRGLVAQLSAEAGCLTVGASAFGLLFALWCQRRLPAWFAYGLPDLQLSMDGAVVAGTVTIAAAVTIVFSVLPAWLICRGPLVDHLGRGGSRTVSPRAPGQRALLAAQIAIALMLVTGAGLMARSMTAVLASAGTDPASVLHYRLRPSRAGYEPGAAARYHRDLLARVTAVPGVRAAALAAVGPERGWCCPIDVSSDAPSAPTAPSIDNNAVTPGYFVALGIPIEAGRGFDARDDAGGTPAVVVNRALGHRLWPGASPIGRRLVAEGRTYEVVGVTPDVHPGRPGEPPVPYAYFAYWQRAAIDARLFVAFDGPPADTHRQITAALLAAGPDVHVGQAGTLAERVTLTHGSQRALASLLEACAVASVVLMALGLYGQLAIFVRRRRRDTAVRLALGASPSQVFARTIGQALRVAGTGVLAGLAAVWLLGRLLERYLFGVGAGDPALLGTAVAGVVFAAALAAVPAARAAARIDPIRLLRAD